MKPKRTIQAPVGKSSISLEDAIRAARIVRRDKTTGRLIVLSREESERIAKRRSERAQSGSTKR